MTIRPFPDWLVFRRMGKMATRGRKVVKRAKAPEGGKPTRKPQSTAIQLLGRLVSQSPASDRVTSQSLTLQG